MNKWSYISQLNMQYPSLAQQGGDIETLWDDAEQFALDYTNRSEGWASWESTLFTMVKENISHMGAEGLLSESAAGCSIVYAPDYSNKIYKVLNKHKRIRTIK